MNIVIGSGRCGTLSTAFLLNGIHEMKPKLPWIVDKELLDKHVQKMEEGKVYVAFFYLNYLEEMEKRFPIRVLCLKRDKEETVDSFLRKSSKENQGREINHLQNDYDHVTDHLFPTYSKEISKADAIRKWWEEYYAKAELRKGDENFLLMDTYELNTEEGQRKIFDFFGIEFPGYREAWKHSRKHIWIK